ncbi:uncharacterized protein DNG_09754 [Cephalotrichum gorgonifer]|uniref:Carrier domain-containing protein n=1 Tax=Cephalotrichum gorgonifer TaxID=2041049 RepID=A0AAE8N8T1_9PEZI|nr:uncharacterized protein DNG_09754 [Cephalotrichum gorgonifer]
MQSANMSAGITRKSFWTQRLQADENKPTSPAFFDKAPDETCPGPDSYGKTGRVMAVSAGDLHVAAFMHHLSAETVVFAAWALLMRSYQGVDGAVGFGACLDREGAAWLFAMGVVGEEKLLSAMRAAEQEKKLMVECELAFKSLAEFGEGTGCGRVETAVYIHSGKTASPDMHALATATLVVQVSEGAMVQAHLAFRKDAVSDEQAQSVVDNFAHTLNTMTKKMQFINKFEADKLLMRDVETVSKGDYRRVVQLCPPLPQRVDAAVHELVFSRCADTNVAHRRAVVAWDGEFTYEEVAVHAARLAEGIMAASREHGLGAGAQIFVPFCLTKSRWTPVAVLAILAAGGVCVPLEPSDSPERTNGVLAQTNAKVVLTNSALFSTLAGSLAADTSVRQVLCVDQDTSPKSLSHTPSLPRVRPDSLCYVMFTSRDASEAPRGVKWQHSALATSLWELGREFHMDEKSRVLQFSSHAFDVSAAELIAPLIHGGCVVVPSDDDRAEPSRMEAFIQAMEVNCALLVPSYARLLRPEAVSSLKTLVFGGESIGQDNLDRWTPAVDRLIIGYGSAETCINSAKNKFSVRTKTQKPWKETLGSPVGSRMLIVDQSNTDRLVPVGAIGEIVVEGPTLAEGYFGDDARTTMAFFENPEWIRKTHFRPAAPRRRFFRTGDLGRQAVDGTITLLGKVGDEPKKLAELQEVRRAVTESLPEAVDAHVDVVCRDGEKSLVAFLSLGYDSQAGMQIQVPNLDLATSLQQMVETLQLTLRRDLVPRFFVPLTGFPYLVSGKLDRQALSDFANRSSVDELLSYNSSFMDFVSTPEVVSMSEDSVSLDTISEEDVTVPTADASEVEEILLSCCREVLRMPSFGVTDNFFASGGDSILAIKAASVARSRGVDITVEDIFAMSTIRELSRVAGACDGLSDSEEDMEIDPFSLLPLDLVNEIVSSVEGHGQQVDRVLDVYPCTPLQEALIALSSMRSGAYVAQYIHQLPRHVDLNRFMESWSAVVKRHDILRTRILESPHGGVQVVYDSDIEWYDGPSVEAYCELDKSIPMGFGDKLVRFALVDRSFIFTIHHSLFDGWSINRVFEDVERQYASQQLLDLQQYKYFIRYLSSLDDAEPKKFWLSKLASDTGLASCHFPQTLSSTFAPIPDSELRLEVPTAKYPRSEFTLPTRIRAAWALLVGRYLDSQDVIFGETLSGRTGTMENIEAVAGPTISTVPVRLTWSSDDSLRALLRDVQSQVVEITNCAQLGVQNISRLSPTAQEACQFQHIVVIQPRKSSFATGSRGSAKAGQRRLSLDEAVLERRSFHSYALNMDFTLGEDGVTIITTFDSRVFKARDIEHLQAQFAHVFDQVCRTRDVTAAKISDIDYAAPLDKELQIETNTQHNLNYERTTLVKILERHAKEQTNAPAVHSWDGSLTYRELDSTSTALANHMASLGIRKGDYVPHCFPKTMWTAVAIMATLKVGAVSVALEPSHPDSSLSKVLSQVRPKLVLCSKESSSRLEALGRSTFAVDTKSIAELTPVSIGGMRRRFSVQAEDTAFVVFTSGSTGEPKGIPLEHSAVCLMAKQHGEAMNIYKSSRILQFAAHVFDVSIGDLAISVFHGACLCVPSDDDRMNNLAHAINSLGANRAWLTPTVASLITPAECPTMEWLSVGGEQLTQACKDIWAGVPLVNVYGPAEVTNLGTAVRVSADLPITNIGRGNGARVWICEQGRPGKLAPAGCIGEIVFEGPNVSSGYLNNAKLTAPSFPEIASWAEKNGRLVRMYRTGDLARLNVDGSLEFKGRRDTQIKLRGQRIEITEVEDALKAAIHEPVELAVDIVSGDEKSGRDAALVAFLHLTGIFSTMDLTDLAIDVRSHMSLVLPPHMVPTLFVPLIKLPKLVSGKIDRKSLRLAAGRLTDEQIGRFRVDRAADKRQPTNEEERTMQRMWAAVLRVHESDVGVDDNFVSLGGDSITAIKLVAHARARGLHLTVSSIFQHATISHLCASLSEAGPADEAKTQPTTVSLGSMSQSDMANIALQCGISVDQIEDFYPCTPLQEGMLMLTEKKPTAYVAHHVMELPSWVDTSIFRRAWEAIVNDNTILRTRILPSGMQVVLRPVPLEWTTVTSNNLKDYIRKTQSEPMGFGKSLTRATVLQGPKRFVWTAHHSVYDGWTMPLLADALTKTYMKLAKPGLPLDTAALAPTINFRAFADWVSKVDKDQAKAFWREQLAGADPAAFPPRLPTAYEPLADSMVELTIPFHRDVKATTTPASIIRAAWAILIYAYSGSHADVVFGSAVTGRSVPLDGVLSLIGPTLATVPLRVVLDPKQPVRELLARVQLQSVAMLEFEQYGLQNIKRSSPEALSACDFQSLLVVHTEAGSAAAENRLSWSEKRNESDFLTNALTLECQPMGSELGIAASYDSSLMDERQMRRILSTFGYILQQLCSDKGNLLVGDIDTLSPSDKSEISQITKTLPPRVNDLVHNMFSRQASATPDALAITAWDGDFTYRQLDQLSTKLAHHLQGLGLGPECFAPFCFEKSKWVPVALLGILKAGGACVPLDPAQPIDRLESIINTLDARIVLTSSTHSQLLKGIGGVEKFVVVSEEALSKIPAQGRRGVKFQATPDSPCYAIFTSGSTGTPKGVVWEHATLCSSMSEHGVAFNYSTKSRVLQFASHTFDVSVSELLTTLVYGGCLCIPDDFTRLNRISEFMNEKRVNWTFFAPSFARLMDPATVPGLQTIVLGGEAPGKDNIERWSGRPGLELIVTYGPAESCIYCAKNSVSGPQIDGSIGHSIGGMMWIADLGRRDELAPIGAVGEIVVEGSILARGYLKDPEKTAASFRAMPSSWANGRSPRIYYTGDLGRVNSDGTISCLGRRDDQVKIRGQRVELAEIEYHLGKDEQVRQALVLYPRTGPCADHLVGILSMKEQPDDDSSPRPASSAEINIAQSKAWTSTFDVQERLMSKVPVYEVPAIWVVLDSIPLMPASQKVNRKMVSEWMKSMDQPTYELIAGLSAGPTTAEPSSPASDELEGRIRNLWSAVLNVSSEVIGPKSSFLRLGGDSISAMQIISRCRNDGIHVTVQDLLKSRTLAEFCDRARKEVKQESVDPILAMEEEVGVSFELSPIQTWFMTLAPQGENHFNQSHLLRLTEKIGLEALNDALLVIAKRHSMLRARFQVERGMWSQFISDDAEGSIQCREFQGVTTKKAASYALNAQASLDIVNGPLLAADLHNMTDGTLALFITCHHLVVDLVSWRIIFQELEEILRTGKLGVDRKPLAFRAWSHLVNKRVEDLDADDTMADVQPADFEFWGISNDDNTPAHVIEQNFTIDKTATDLLLGQSNEAFNTEPLDLLLAAVAHSFNATFRDVRDPVVVFNEGHGREPWRSDVDLSSTVGWFTSMCPILLPDHGDDALRSLQDVKDFRRRVPEKGLPFFTKFARGASSGVEVTFNYFGLYQQLERDDALLNRMSWASATPPSDSSPDVPRFSLFDVSAGVEDGEMFVNFAFSDKIKHRGLVQQWIESCSETLNDLIDATSQSYENTLTLSDLPHLPATYDELSALLDTTLPEAGISKGNVQDIYPCSPMQTALLVSQAIDPSLYAVRYIWEAVPKPRAALSLDRVVQAWKQVVSLNPMLRTEFVQTVPFTGGKNTSVYSQVVLKDFDPSVSICEDPSSFPVGRPSDHLQDGPAHHLTLCEKAGKLLVQLDISHTLIDGTSINILLDQMIKAYDANSDGTPSSTFADQDCYAHYVSYLRNQDLDASRGFWKTYLAGAEPCQFPTLRTYLDGAESKTRRLDYLDFKYENPKRLHSLCTATETTAASVFKLAWALLLKAYTGNNSPCFGYLASGRDLPIRGIEDSIGPFINMLVCKVSLEEGAEVVEDVLKTAHTDYASCLEHQVCSLVDIIRSLNLGGERLFNTVMSVQRNLPPGTVTSGIEFRSVEAEDPSEFDIVLNIGDSAELVEVSLTYNTALLTGQQASRFAYAFNTAIDGVLDSLSKPVNSVALVPLDDYQQIQEWNAATDLEPIPALCDDLIQKHLSTQADKVAVSGWDLSMTYSVLDSMAETLATHLKSKYSLGRDTLVPFCFEKSAWAIVVMLGIMKAGAAFVPLDPKHPADRIAQIVQRVRAPLIICSKKNEPVVKGVAKAAGLPHLVFCKEGMEKMKKTTTVGRKCRAIRTPSDLAYCLFTSGSTGTPKGVLIQHQTLCTSCTAHGNAFGYTKSSRALQFASYVFDACIAEILTILIMGGTVCVPSDAQKMDPEQLTKYIRREKIDLVFLTPSFLSLMDPAKVPSVKTLLVGGEIVQKQLVSRWLVGGRRVEIVYGPTECCVYCSGFDYADRDDMTPGKNFIGTNVGSVSWITDAHDYNKLLPIGAIGELLVEGPILAKGYLDDETKTSESFVKPEWMGGERMVYRTGDLVRYSEDGSLEYLGRRDNQVKLRGQRLELGEIEEQLIKDPEVQQCVVLLLKEGLCSQKLVAVLTFATEDETSRIAGTLMPVGGVDGLNMLAGEAVTGKLSKLSEFATGVLPRYMVPSCWVVTDNMPLLPSGKADRRLLTSCIANIDDDMNELSVKWSISSAPAKANTSVPDTKEEEEEELPPAARTLRRVWSSVLNVPEDRVDTSAGSFIRMGGDSISAMEVVAMCRAEGMHLLIENLLKATSINTLASSIEPPSQPRGSGNGKVERVVERIVEEEEEEEEDGKIVLFGLSPIQRMFANLSPGESHFNQSFLVKVSPDKARLSETDVRHALNVIVRRHAMLRARFQPLGRTFKQWIEPDVEESYTLQEWDVAKTAPFPAEAVSRIVDTQRSLDLSDGPVFAGDLFSVGGEQYIFLTAHHLVVDLVSWRIILKDLEDYLTTGSISNYRSLSFEKWSALLNTHRKSLLDGPKSGLLPFDAPESDYAFWGMDRRPNLASDFEHHQFTLPATVSQSLLGPCNEAFGSEALDLFISAVMHSFATTFPGREIPPIYNESHGRETWDDSQDLSRTVGWFTTIAPVWVSGRSCRGDIVQFVRQVKDARRRTPKKGFNYFTSYDFEKRPFEIEVSFNYFGAFQQLDRDGALLKQVHWRNIEVDPCEVSDEQKKFSLIDISAEIEAGQLVFTFGFNSKMKHGAELRRWMSRCQKSLEHLAGALDSRQAEHTATDFEHLPEDYDLDGLRDSTFKDLGIQDSNVADIYPCSPTQQGMLLTQSKDPEMYWFRSVYEVKTGSKRPMTMDRLRQAWKAVVQRHPILRTVFVEQNSTDGLYDQLVLRNHEPSIFDIELDPFADGDDLLHSLKIQSVPSELQAFRAPQHQLRLARQRSSGRIFCSFLLSHAIVDGGSMGILLRDFALACDAKLVATDDLQYKNYITYLKSRDHERDVTYWKQSLDGIDPCFLPADPTDSGAARELHKTGMPSDPSAYTKMISVAREMGVSPFTLLQVTWALTLREFVNPDREECAFGVVTSGRDLPVEGIQDIAGPFVNILASRVAFGEDEPVSAIAERVHGGFIDNVAHQTASLAEIMHELGTGKLFNTGMTLQKILPGKKMEQGVEFAPIGGDDPTEFDVVVHAVDTGKSMDIHMNHWTDKVSDRRATEIARVFSSILSQITENPDIVPFDLHTISQRDLKQLWSWNANLPPALDKRIEEMIAQQVAQNPNREALWSSEQTVTYQQLDLMATRLAHSHLAELDREEIVPLCFEKSIWAAVAMVAVLKAGGTVVLMDPTHPVERLRSIVGTVKAKLILASPSQADLCSRELGIRTVSVSKDIFNRRSSMPGALARSTMRPKRRSSADAAYIVFTSGSTGTPKGSVTEHRSFATATQGYHKAIGQLPGTRVLQFASYSFDASVLEILGSLMIGATVCVPTEAERTNQLVAFVNKAKVSFAVITPTVASLLNPEDVPTLSCLALCGEPMTTSHISKWADKIRLVNAFGPSECCVGSASNPRLTQESSPKCIGWAVSCCYWVVHPRNHNRLARVGSVGELLIEGAILARHYLGEEEKTKAAFISAPEWAKTGRATRLYKTGDLVTQNADGSFQYVGRKDAQAKIRGQRLELGDVEQAFREVVPCQSAVAEVVKSEGQQSRLVVFFSGKDTINADASSVDLGGIQAKMALKVPAYMVPAAIIPLAQLPTMPSGKVDRKKIKALGAALPTRRAKRAGRLPETEMEITLASLWKDVVKTDRIQAENILADDSFFEVGGDSYTAMRLVTEARARGVILNVSTVMKAPKLSDMARKATRSTGTSAMVELQATEPFSMVIWTPAAANEASRQCAVPSDKIEDVYPCTPLQEGLFVLSVKQPGSYIAQHCYSLSPDLDLGRYKEAWRTVYDSSSILRTHIVQLNNIGGASGRKSGLYQAVIKKSLTWDHFTSLDSFLAKQPMPSIGGALVQFTFIEEPLGERFMVLTMHHAAYDAASIQILLDGVESVYRGGERPSSTPFREFIKYLEGNKGQMTREFWSEYMDGARSSSFPVVPVGYVPSADSTFDFDVAIPAQGGGYTVSTMIRTAWAMVMAQQMGSSDVVFGETLSGRNDAQDSLADVEGPLITTVPVRCQFGEDDLVSDVLSAMQMRMIDMMPYQHAGLQNIRLLSPDAAAACNFTCLVTIAHASEAEPKPSLGITPIEGPEAVAMDYPMSIQFILSSQRSLRVSVSYDDQLIDGVQMTRIVEQFAHVLTQFYGREGMTVKEVGMEMEQVAEEIGFGPLRRSPVDILERIENLPEEVSTQNLSKADTLSKDGSFVNVTHPTPDLEQDIRGLWAEILGMDAAEIQSEDNFFHLGGDSIGAMRLVTAAEQKKIKVTVADIFHHPTLQDLCEFAAQASAVVPVSTGGTETPVVEYQPYMVLEQLGLPRNEVMDGVCRQLSVFPGDVEDVYPATDYQAWAVSHGLMRSRGNTNYFLFRFHGDLDTFRLEQACRKMVASNPILRTLFTTIGSQVMQVVLRSYQIEFQRYGREHRADDSFIRWLVEQDTQRSTYLSQSIVRFKLLRHIQGHYVLVMRVSHAQYDGMSLPLLYQDLEKCYGGLEAVERPSFGSFIHAATAREEEAINFWGNLLEGSAMSEIVQHTGPAFKHNVDTIRRRRLPPIPTNVAGMSQATLVKAAWAVVLAKMSGQRDVVFGNLIFGRNIPVSGIEDISGPCINMIPVRVKVNEMDSIHDLLALVQEQQLAAMSHESLGFRRLVKDCTDWPDWTRFSSVLQHQNLGRDGAQEFQLGDNLKCEMGVLGPAYDSSDLWVQTTPHADSFHVEIGSCSAVVSPEIAETLLDRLCAILNVFSSVGSGNDRHLWELLARDHAPLIPIKSSVVDRVWDSVLPDATFIPWDTPYFELWGDEIAPVRFLEEYAEHGIVLDMEDILEHPTKQAQMMLTARVLADRNGTSRDSAPKKSFWVHDNKSGGSRSSSSRGSSATTSPMSGSPQINPVAPRKSFARRRSSMKYGGSREGSYWDMPSQASWSDKVKSSVNSSSPALSSAGRSRTTSEFSGRQRRKRSVQW